MLTLSSKSVSKSKKNYSLHLSHIYYLLLLFISLGRELIECEKVDKNFPYIFSNFINILWAIDLRWKFSTLYNTMSLKHLVKAKGTIFKK